MISIGLKTADQVAQKIGIPHDSILRTCGHREGRVSCRTVRWPDW
jgi:hypothetical protein